MEATAPTHVSERDLSLNIDTILRMAYQPEPFPASKASTNTHPLEGRDDGGLTGCAIDPPVHGPLKNASLDRLACLLRHWTWADEAMARFERELANGWEYDEDPRADHPFGAYYQWCALLCGLSEAALEHELLSALQLEALRPDLEASLSTLRACRQLLVAIPAVIEEHPRIVDLLRDVETLGRLRRLHYAFRDALRQEQTARELESRIGER